MALAAKTPEFKAFAHQASAFKGLEIDEDWLLEIWSGADCDANRALNHVLDTPDDKVKIKGSSKPVGDDSFPAPPVGDDAFFDDPPGFGQQDWGSSTKEKKAKKEKKNKKRATGTETDVWGASRADDAWTESSAHSHAPSFAQGSAFGVEDPFGGNSAFGDTGFGGNDFGNNEWGVQESKQTSRVPDGFSDWGPTDPASIQGRSRRRSQESGRSRDQTSEQQGAWDQNANEYGGYSSTSQQPAWSQTSAMVESESDSENEWWHMPTLRNLLSSQQIDQMVFETYTRHCPSGRAGLAEMQGIAQEVSYNARITAHAFKYLQVLQERFDFSGDGVIDVQEAVHLIKSCLRYYHKENDPRANRAKDMKLPRRNLSDQFVMLKKLGQGGQGSMFLVREHRQSDEMRCVKVYEKGNANAPLDDIKEEFELMRKLDSPFVARTYDIFEDRSNVYLVNEPYFGGNLTKLIANAHENGVPTTEDWFKGVFRQPVQGIQYLNQQHMMHCDLKEANVMVANDSNWQEPHVVLIDFGLSMSFAGPIKGVSGTPGYIAPETWQKGYWVPKGDVFSLGVMFFQLLGAIDQLFGAFMGARTMEDVMQATCSAPPPFELFETQPEFQELLRQMLEKDPLQRCTIFQTLQHPWFSSMTGAQISPQVLEFVRQAARKTETEMQIAEMMLDRFNLGGMHHLSQAFLTMDHDNSGVITADEASQAAANVSAELGVAAEEMEQIIMGIADANGNVSYRRFMSAMIHQQRGFGVTDLWERFCQIDTDRNGVLDQQELLRVIQSMNYSEQDSWSLMQSLDRDQDGYVTFEEFKRAILG